MRNYILLVFFLVRLYAGDLISEASWIAQNGRAPYQEKELFLLSEIEKVGFVLKTGTDAELRPSFVGARVDIERALTHLLETKQIHSVCGIFLAHAPDKFLCEYPNHKAENYGAKERPQYLRDYLQAGGDLVCVYPKNGLEKRTKEQMGIYQAELFASPHLIDCPLSIAEFPEPLRGALYLFTTAEGERMCLNIHTYASCDLKDGREWAVWFGKLSDPNIAGRVKEITAYLSNCNNKQLESFLLNNNLK